MNNPVRSSIQRNLAVGAGASLVLLLAACGGSTSSSPSSASAVEPSSPPPSVSAVESSPATEAAPEPVAAGSDSLSTAVAQNEKALKGNFTSAPSDPNPAAKGKKLWIVVSGLASPTAANSAKNTTEAATLLGWETKVYDSKLDPSNFPKGIQAAIAAGADGIITVGIDCPYIKQDLKDAAAAKVMTVGLYSLDCNEVDPSQGPEYSSSIGFGDRYANLADAFRAWGADAAAWVIANTDAQANVISLDNSEYTILVDYQQGFSSRMAQCTTCKLAIVPWLGAEFGPPVTSKTEAALQRNPDANAIQVNVNPTLGFTQGVVNSGRADSLKSIGGFGLASDFDVIRNKQGLNAVVAIPDQWWSFAAADTLNSLFNGTPVRDSGTGWQTFDDQSTLPEAGKDFVADNDYATVYKTSWGVVG